MPAACLCEDDVRYTWYVRPMVVSEQADDRRGKRRVIELVGGARDTRKEEADEDWEVRGGKRVKILSRFKGRLVLQGWSRSDRKVSLVLPH